MQKRIRALLRPWINRDVYRCLAVEWSRARLMRPEAPPTGAKVHVRLVDRLELAAWSDMREYEISAKFLNGIDRRADMCLGAFVRDELLSYAFFAPTSPTAIDEHLYFQFPPRWIYVYKTFTLPAQRGKGLLPFLLMSSMPRIQKWLAGRSGPAGFVTLAMAHNPASVRAFERAGFSATLEFPVWNILSQHWPVAMPSSHATNFGIACAVGEAPAQV
jgi:hypothetical protein